MKPDFSEVHPELRAGINKIPQFTFTAWNVGLLRLLMKLQPVPKAPDDLLIENVSIPTLDNKAKIRLRVYKPRSNYSVTPVLLWIHGGGYIIGNPEMDESRCIRYVRELGIVVVSVDYRLAPKYPFPAPLDDCYSALNWVYSHAAQLNIDPNRIAVGGESAGAGLAASLVQIAVDRQAIKPIFQLLIYPMLDDRTVIRADSTIKTHINWNRDSNRLGWKSYLSNMPGTANLPAYAVPSRRLTLAGLPPAWIGVGTLDLFYQEDIAYAQQLRADGVECEIVEVAGAFHGFDREDLPQVIQDFRKSQAAALKRCLFPAG